MPDFVSLPNIGGVALFVLVAWIIYRQRNSDAAALLARTLERVTNLENRVDRFEDRERRHSVVLQEHATWDARAVGALSPEQAAALGSPPPLYPED